MEQDWKLVRDEIIALLLNDEFKQKANEVQSWTKNERDLIFRKKLRVPWNVSGVYNELIKYRQAIDKALESGDVKALAYVQDPKDPYYIVHPSGADLDEAADTILEKADEGVEWPGLQNYDQADKQKLFDLAIQQIARYWYFPVSHEEHLETAIGVLTRLLESNNKPVHPGDMVQLAMNLEKFVVLTDVPKELRIVALNLLSRLPNIEFSSQQLLAFAELSLSASEWLSFLQVLDQHEKTNTVLDILEDCIRSQAMRFTTTNNEHRYIVLQETIRVYMKAKPLGARVLLENLWRVEVERPIRLMAKQKKAALVINPETVTKISPNLKQLYFELIRTLPALKHENR